LSEVERVLEDRADPAPRTRRIGLGGSVVDALALEQDSPARDPARAAPAAR
jgi:hypothetical protein